MDDSIKLLESDLNENIKFNQVEKLKQELDKEYQSYFKAKVNNMSYYYERKQERIESHNQNRRKHKTSVDSNDSDSLVVPNKLIK